jgi:hypothetical protein
MAIEIEVSNDPVLKVQEDVRARRYLKPREDLLRRRGPADYMPSFQHEDIKPGASEVGGGDQPIVACTHYDDVMHAVRPPRVR